MKHKTLIIIIGLLFIALLTFVFFGRPYKPNSRSNPPKKIESAEQAYAPEALAIRDKLYAKSKEYGAKTKRQTQLQKEIDQLEADKSILAEAASGYDRVLCADFRLQYARPNASSLSGSLLTGCDFQQGTPSAQ